MPRIVRRQPLIERIKAYLNPFDFLLWLSEELESNGWDQLEKEWALPIGLGLNLLVFIARANMNVASRTYDDVFGEVRGGSGGLVWLASFLVHLLTLFSVVNAVYTFWRKRHYRLFETSVDAIPSTPSAYRVNVDSSPVSSSPLRFLSSILGADNAQARAHPDPQRDVWEVAVWDPLPVSLRLFCYFSPGHVLVYWLFLPTLPTDPRPSTTIVTSIVLAILLTLQLSILQSNFSQQGKDSALISKEVLHEYDTKYVRPRTQPLYRDVSTQYSEQAAYNSTRDQKYNVVETYRPTVLINRGFNPNPNPNYSKQFNPDGAATRSTAVPRMSSTPSFAHSNPGLQTPGYGRDSSSPIRPNTAIRQPNFLPIGAAGISDGGNLGVYSHAASPLRKNTSTGIDRSGQYSNDYAKERSSLSPEKRQSSPSKRMSVPAGGINTLATTQRWSHLQPGSGRRESGRF